MAEKKLYPESIVRPTPNSIECPICGEIVRRPELGRYIGKNIIVKMKTVKK